MEKTGKMMKYNDFFIHFRALANMGAGPKVLHTLMSKSMGVQTFWF